MSLSVTENIKTHIDERKGRVIFTINVVTSKQGRGYQRFRLKLPQMQNIDFDSLGHEPHQFREKMEEEVSNMLLRLAEVMAGMKEEKDEEEKDWWVEITATALSLEKMMERSKVRSLIIDMDIYVDIFILILISMLMLILFDVNVDINLMLLLILT